MASLKPGTKVTISSRGTGRTGRATGTIVNPRRVPTSFHRQREAAVDIPGQGVKVISTRYLTPVQLEEPNPRI